MKTLALITLLFILQTGCSLERSFLVASDSYYASQVALIQAHKNKLITDDEFLQFDEIADRTDPIVLAGLSDIETDGKLDNDEVLSELRKQLRILIDMRLAAYVAEAVENE